MAVHLLAGLDAPTRALVSIAKPLTVSSAPCPTPLESRTLAKSALENGKQIPYFLYQRTEWH